MWYSFMSVGVLTLGVSTLGVPTLGSVLPVLLLLLLLLLKPAAQAQVGKTKLFIIFFHNPTITCETEN